MSHFRVCSMPFAAAHNGSQNVFKLPTEENEGLFTKPFTNIRSQAGLIKPMAENGFS